MSEILRLATNIPEEIALRFPDGRQVPSKIEGAADQMMYTLVDGRVAYFPLHVAERIRELRVAPGERISVCKAEVRTGQTRKIEWQVKRVDPPAQQQPPQPAPQTTAPAKSAGQGSGNNGVSAAQQNGGCSNGSTANARNGTAPANGAAAPPLKVEFADALYQFILIAGRSYAKAQKQLAQEGQVIQFDSRDIAAAAVSLFIHASRDKGWVTWHPEVR